MEKIPNAETQAAMRESNARMKLGARFATIQELFDHLDKARLNWKLAEFEASFEDMDRASDSTEISAMTEAELAAYRSVK